MNHMKLYKKIVPASILLFISFFMLNCKKDIDIDSLRKSVIWGENVKYLPADVEDPFFVLGKSDNIKVILEGIVNKTTYTDSTGKYFFNDVPTGTYNLTYTKDGYGSVKKFSIKHYGNDTSIIIGNIRLYPKIVEEIDGIVEKVDTPFYPEKTYVPFSVVNEIESFSTDAIIFMKQGGHASHVNYDQYYEKFISSSFGHFEDYEYLTWFSIREMNNDGFIPGEKVSFIIHLKCNNDHGYFDYEQGRQVFPTMSLKGSSEISFIFP